MYVHSRIVLAILTFVLTITAPLSVNADVVTFLTSGASYATPSDWDNSNNSIECIGPGGNGGANNTGGGGGGGGAYAKITNLTLAGSISYVIGAGGTLNDTYFNGAASTTASLSCAPGKSGSGATNGAGGLTANSTGTTKFAGGAGGIGGGGGAGGTTGAGSDGLGTGGNGGTASGGAGGSNGTFGGEAGFPGEDGTVWQVSPARGAGGGGGQGGPGEFEVSCAANGGPGGNGGLYGGGAGGGGPRGNAACVRGDGGVGAQGIITITYTPVVVAAGGAKGIKIKFARFKIYSGGLKIR